MSAIQLITPNCLSLQSLSKSWKINSNIFPSPCSFQMHDFLPLLVAPTIQIRDKLQPLNFGIFGTIKLSFPTGPTTDGAAYHVVAVTCSNPLLPLVGIIEQTVSFRWKSPLLRLSMVKPVMVRDRHEQHTVI